MFAALLAVIAAVATVAQLAGQERPDRRGIEMSLGAGVGWLGTSCDSCRGGGGARQSGAAVHVWVGAPVGPDLLVGLDIVHWSTPQRDTGVALTSSQ